MGSREHVEITDLQTQVPLTFGVLVDSYRVAVEFPCGDELLDGFIDGSR
jgi:hypothetical protein